jgi:hypothetical protein
MTVRSKRRRNLVGPLLGVISASGATLYGAWLVTHGYPVAVCLIFAGLLGGAGWIWRYRTEVSEIIVSDDIIEFRRRRTAPLVISRVRVTNSAVMADKIWIQYDNDGTLLTTALPFCWFDSEDLGALMKEFPTTTEPNKPTQGNRGGG